MNMEGVLNLTNDVYWIGVKDPGLVIFDVIMETKYGTTYNSYFINAEKPTVIETVKHGFEKEYLNKIRQLIDPWKIEYIVVNHTEPDHVGAIATLLDYAPQATIVGSQAAIRFLQGIVNKTFTSKVIKEGDTLDLGNKTLRFIAAPFLHWPDTMYTLLEEDKALFTCDSFGCHYTFNDIFVEEIEKNPVEYQDFMDSYKYYFDCIMSPFSKYVLEATDKLMKEDFNYIFTGHGPVLGSNHWKYINLYRKWAMDTLNGINIVTH